MLAQIVVMGPSGSGKSVIGAALASALGLPFIDADDLHPPANVGKMAAGEPLDDDDRMPWLDDVAAAAVRSPPGVVIACSALARRYRDRLRAGAPAVRFVELVVGHEELERRMRDREHFMPVTLLGSQLAVFEALDATELGARVENSGSVEEVVHRARAALGV